MRRLLLASAALLVIATSMSCTSCTSCKTEPTPTGFESPSATIDTLFRAYDIQDMSQEEARRRLEARERFELLDAKLFRRCFSDWQGEHDQALGGFVFGQLVAAKDELLITVEDSTAQVRAASASPDLQPIVFVEQDGAWKIDLRQSVAPKIRQSLYEIYRRARRAERQAP
ncbi:MAG: hypothetical protein JRJ10_07065 [Deltaproteobacteria bacterium]|nr:hypothetical protein [Deltaproteobacteria bacterium]MBW2402734.1 hypothetical protein [Deltaproteobacteria bacterium]MBW2547435.1 hypothetical protein [Deltaproteobacteria bacterium]MBW2719446.1 hypothetical protein [Deltaproteobacteria bacterium]